MSIDAVPGRKHPGPREGLIVAAAIEPGRAELPTEDMREGREIGGLAIRDPFQALG